MPDIWCGECEAWQAEVEHLQTRIIEMEHPIPRPLEEWDEEDGPVLWWFFPVAEPPYCGCPLDSEWPGFHTHWTPIHVPVAPQP